MTEPDYGPMRSQFLEEVRTVLSRAETALAALKRDPEHYGRLWHEHPVPVFGEAVKYEYQFHGRTYVGKTRPVDHYTEGVWEPHPGFDDAVQALESLIASLSKFKKRGRKKS